VLSGACQLPEPAPAPGTEEIVRGRRLFFAETFAGNGRTCGTCHPANNNFTLDPAFIARLPGDDPLFVAGTSAGLGRRFENDVLMRGVGLILENLDGFDDLDERFNMRGIPHTLGLRLSTDSRAGPRLGWSGDGAPGDGSLRAFATGAVIQHFTKSTNRVAGVDFRLPTDEELDALAAFQRALGRPAELALPLPLRSAVAARGQALFTSPTRGKCSACHANAGANAAPEIFGAGAGNLDFDTGVEDLPDAPADLLGEKNPPDDGHGRPGNGTFNTPSLVEAADTPPFFHDNSVATLEAAVAFYDGESFDASPAGQALAAATGSGIELDATEIAAIAAFLRAVNALENIRAAVAMLDARARRADFPTEEYAALMNRARDEIEDAIDVLEADGLHPEAVHGLARADSEIRTAARRSRPEEGLRRALAELARARSKIIGEAP
jgi:cytochrome c peroxidase